MEGWFGLVLILIVGGGFAAGNIFLSQFLGPSKPIGREIGALRVRHARGRRRPRAQSVKFYLVAMIFLLFDIEVAFLYPWALALRDLRWVGFIADRVFFALLLTGFVYIWRKGVLDWSRRDE